MDRDRKDMRTPEKEHRPKPTIIKRRNSSFASTSSPWFRRNSFLSPSMIDSENYSVYECPNYFNDSSSNLYNIISLKEYQGFIFNQDLFASPYQQLKSLANERKYRTFSFNHSKKSRSNSYSNLISNGSKISRRHTSHLDSRPTFLSSNAKINDLAIDDDDDDKNTNSKMEIDILAADDFKTAQTEDAVVDEYDEFDDHTESPISNNLYKVHVTEIMVNEDDDSIFPSI